ncbi:MAG: trypsin-like peptidase domain-containing protein [Acidobacteriota bacterium]
MAIWQAKPDTSRTTLRVALVFLLSSLFCIGGQAQANLSEFNRTLVELADKLSGAVVQISGDSFQPAILAPGGGEYVALRRSTGSGVVIGADGLIVTNAHVVEGNKRLQVQFAPPEAPERRSIVRPLGRVLPARILGVDRETDLALLKVDATGLPFLELADSDQVKQGQLVLALGSPVGLPNSVSMGIVSAVARQLRPDDRMVYIQTDASINPGNSGGALVNIEGKVIGINTLIASQSGGSEGIGFAVPSNIVRSVTQQLQEHGALSRGDIGVEAQTITPVLAAALRLERDQGVLLADVIPNGPAYTSGLQAGDIVLSLDGKPMENARQFLINLYPKPLASTVRLQILRQGQRLEKIVVVLRRSDDPRRFESLVDEQQNLVARLGVLAIELDKTTHELMPWLRHRTGILVARLAVTATGPMDLLQPGDVIYQLNTERLHSLDRFRSLLEGFKSGEVIVLHVQRGQSMRFVEVPLN